MEYPFPTIDVSSRLTYRSLSLFRMAYVRNTVVQRFLDVRRAREAAVQDIRALLLHMQPGETVRRVVMRLHERSIRETAYEAFISIREADGGGAPLDWNDFMSHMRRRDIEDILQHHTALLQHAAMRAGVFGGG